MKLFITDCLDSFLGSPYRIVEVGKIKGFRDRDDSSTALETTICHEYELNFRRPPLVSRDYRIHILAIFLGIFNNLHCFFQCFVNLT